MSKSAIAAIKVLKEELGTENPEQILEKVRELKSKAEALMEQMQKHAKGVASLTLCLDYGMMRYGFSWSGVESLEDMKAIQGVMEHFRREILEPQIKKLEIEAEVQRRMATPGEPEE